MKTRLSNKVLGKGKLVLKSSGKKIFNKKSQKKSSGKRKFGGGTTRKRKIRADSENLSTSDEEENSNFQRIITRIKHNDIQKLELFFKSQEEVELFIDAFKTNTSLKILHLLYNQIFEKHVILIAKILETNHSLQNLEIRSMNIGNEGAKALAEVLKINTTLKEIGYFAKDIDKQLFLDALYQNHNLTKLEYYIDHPGFDSPTETAIKRKLSQNAQLQKKKISKTVLAKRLGEEQSKKTGAHSEFFDDSFVRRIQRNFHAEDE
jgi:hypothetical protein